MKWYRRLALSIVIGSFLPASLAQAQELYFDDVLKTAFSNHPDLQSSAVQVKMRKAEGMQIEGALDTRYGASIGVSDEQSQATNAFSPEANNVAFVSGQLSKTFSGGSSLTGTLNYNRSELAYPSTTPANIQSSPNPIYMHQIDLIYRYPLASGADNPTYRYQKDAARQEVKAAEFRVQMLREQLANQGIALYFQFILSDLSLELAKDGVVRAKRLLSYQKKRERFGLIEKSERLQAEALLATRQLQQVQAVSARDMAQTALNRFMFKAGGQPIEPKLKSVHAPRMTESEMFLLAELRRPIFKVLKAQYAAAEARLAQANESDEHQLDLVGQVGSRALDEGSGAAFGQGFTLNDRFVALRVEFSDVFDNKTSRAVIQRNVLALENIKIEQRKTIENIKTELANIAAMIRGGEATLKASKQQVNAEKKKFNAEMLRYQEGRSSTTAITQFEGDLRSAELRALIQKVSLNQAEYQLALTLGKLPAVFGEEL